MMILKLNEKNKPRVFSNSVNIKTEKSTFDKSIFTFVNLEKMMIALHGLFNQKK